MPLLEFLTGLTPPLKDRFPLLLHSFFFVHSEQEDSSGDEKEKHRKDARLDASGDGNQDSIDQGPEDRGKFP